jgi:hypothetical protein
MPPWRDVFVPRLGERVHRTQGVKEVEGPERTEEVERTEQV